VASASTAGARPAGLLGAAAPGDRAIARLAAAALDRPHVEVCRWWVEPVAYRIGSPITAGLLRVRGVAAAGGRALPWSLFVKLLRSWRHWPGLQALPPALRERARADPSWRYEADVYRSDLAAALPDGLRLPRLHRSPTSATGGSRSGSRTWPPRRRRGTCPASGGPPACSAGSAPASPAPGSVWT
jgi:hypothetical protein